MISPMRLEGFELEELVVRTKQPGNAEDRADFSLSTRHGRSASGNKFKLHADLRVAFHENTRSSFAELIVSFNGTFVFPKKMPDEAIRRFYPLLAMANLLGVVRGALMQNTALFKGGPFILPLLNLNDFTLMNEEGEKILFPERSIASTSVSAPKKAARKAVTRKT